MSADRAATVASTSAVESFPNRMCVVSERFEFIYLAIAKVASSTCRIEFDRPYYSSRECLGVTLDAEIREKYFTFTFLRDPVSRTLSAYQEVSFRHDLGEEQNQNRPFY